MAGTKRSVTSKLQAALCIAAIVGVQSGPGAAQQAAAATPAGQAEATPAATPTVLANININPKRITFDRIGKSAAVYVFNQGGAVGGFDVKLIDRVMLPDGQIVPLSEAEAKPELKDLVARLKSAKDMVVVTPRRVSLSGNAGQTLRIRAGTSAEVAPGEYRTHLTVTAIPPADIGVTAEQAASQREGQLSFRINSVLGLSIPVILRVGPIDIRAGIENAKLSVETAPTTAGKPPVTTSVLAFELVRVGANSLFGDIEVRGAKERGDKEPLGVVRGVGVYPEIDRRFVKIALRRVPAAGEQVEIIFRDDDTSPGKQLSKVIIPAP